MRKTTQELDVTMLAEKWPSNIVARSEVHRLTGGAIKPQSAANLDSRGDGCPTRFMVNGKIVYPVTDFLEWLKARGKNRAGGGGADHG